MSERDTGSLSEFQMATLITFNTMGTYPIALSQRNFKPPPDAIQLLPAFRNIWKSGVYRKIG